MTDPADIRHLSAWYGMRCRDNRGDPKPAAPAARGTKRVAVVAQQLSWSLGTVCATPPGR